MTPSTDNGTADPGGTLTTAATALAQSHPELALDLQLAATNTVAPATEEFTAWCRAAIATAVPHRSGPLELTIRIVDEAEGASLNQRYRDRAGATNVLAFPFEPPPGLELAATSAPVPAGLPHLAGPPDPTDPRDQADLADLAWDPGVVAVADWHGNADQPTPDAAPPCVPDLSGLLGDLVICAPVVQREATAQGKPARAHWAHLTVHGILHLLGYDHTEPAAAATMEALETAILDGLGFPPPYETDDAPP
ncbi:MAG: rRNA maturation RNase YbeY [Chromatiaceae bacterium]|nr:MAG: rRNA maturation RNase YbeY [Chromatiaceae bacterium]